MDDAALGVALLPSVDGSQADFRQIVADGRLYDRHGAPGLGQGYARGFGRCCVHAADRCVHGVDYCSVPGVARSFPDAADEGRVVPCDRASESHPQKVAGVGFQVGADGLLHGFVVRWTGRFFHFVRCPADFLLAAWRW